MMKLNPKGSLRLFKEAAKDWSDDKAPRLGASLAYYTIFSISPLVLIVIAIAGLWFRDNPDLARTAIMGQLGGLVGENGAKAIESMLVSAQKPTGPFAAIVASITLFLGATGVFIQLQDALNSIWKVKQAPGGGIWGFVVHRLLSFAMILSIGFLLLVSLVVTAALDAFGKYVGGFFPEWVILGKILNFAISFGVVTLLFAVMFKLLPDVKMPWRDVWTGALFTALLFTVGKTLLGMYLGRSSVSSAYGAAGSLVVLLLWVYYSAQILFFGCEVTRVHARHAHSKIVPKKHAVWVSESEAVGEPTDEGARHPAEARDRPIPARRSSPARPHVKGGFAPFPSFVLLLLMILPVSKTALRAKKHAHG